MLNRVFIPLLMRKFPLFCMLFRIKISINIICLSDCERNFNEVSKKVNFIFRRILVGGKEPHKGEFVGQVFSSRSMSSLQ